jgi:hypothetical protein
MDWTVYIIRCTTTASILVTTDLKCFAEHPVNRAALVFQRP